MRKVIFVIIILSCFALSIEAKSKLDTLGLEGISRKLENPLTNLWSLTFQKNLYVLSGNLTCNKQYADNLFFQPFLPFRVGNKFMLTFRPIFPLITSPGLIEQDTIKTVDYVTGLGDIQLLTLPQYLKKSNVGNRTYIHIPSRNHRRIS